MHEIDNVAYYLDDWLHCPYNAGLLEFEPHLAKSLDYLKLEAQIVLRIPKLEPFPYP